MEKSIINQTRLIIIGLDGVGLDLATRLTSQGIMPNLGYLLDAGAGWATTSPLPEVSPVSWTTMFTGVNPGEHGVFGFAEHLPGSYQTRIVDATMLKTPRLWDYLNAIGRRSIVANVPLTYPASSTASVMISGFVVPELTRAVYPPSWLNRLHFLGYRPEADLDQGSLNLNVFISDLLNALDIRLIVFEELLDELWDCFIVVFTDTDRVNHFFWPALMDDAHPLAAQVKSVYARIDAFLGRIVNRFAANFKAGILNLMVVSDHSFTSIRSEVYLNPWLIKMGYLKVEGVAGNERILPESIALALDPGRIYLHRITRFPQGRFFTWSQVRTILENIRSSLMNLRFKRVINEKYNTSIIEDAPIAQVHIGHDLYYGSRAYMAPDIVVTPAKGFSLRSGLGRGNVIFGRSHLTGTHQATDALALMWPILAKNQRPTTIEGLYSLMKTSLGLN